MRPRLLMLIAGLGLLLAACASPVRSATDDVQLPSYAYTSQQVLAGYRAAAKHTELFTVLPCYCGCVGQGHQNLKECFIKPDGTSEQHAAGCDVCVREAVLAAQLKESGKDAKEIRTQIDARFKGFGKPTDTAMPQ